jgi:hypothetical protein
MLIAGDRKGHGRVSLVGLGISQSPKEGGV